MELQIILECMESTKISIAAHFVKKQAFHKTKNDDQLSGSQGTKFARIAMAAVCIMAVAGWLDVRAMATCSSGFIYCFIFRF